MPNKPKRLALRPGRPSAAERDSAAEHCLRAAAEMFLDSAVKVSDPFAGLSRNRAARAVGLSPNSVYNRYPSEDAWQEAIATYLLGRTDTFREEFEHVQATMRASAGRPFVDRVLETADADLGTLADNPAWNAMEVLATCVAPKSDSVAATARACYRELDDATWDDIYGQLVTESGREPRPPFTKTAIGAVLQAFVEGAGIRHLFDAGTYLDPYRLGHGRHGSYPMTVVALLAVLTRPVDGDRRDVLDLVTELLEGQSPTGD